MNMHIQIGAYHPKKHMIMEEVILDVQCLHLVGVMLIHTLCCC